MGRALQLGVDDFLSKDEVSGGRLERAVRFAVGRKEARGRLEFLAHYHPLTGLPNRTLFKDRLSKAIDRANRHNQDVAMVLVNLDRLSELNETFGRDAGDRLLETVAERLRSCARASDTLAHMGGDEFAVILEEVGGPQGAESMVRRVLEVLRRPVEQQGVDVLVSGSFGIAMLSDSRDADRLVQDAEEAMFAAKRMGRGTIASSAGRPSGRAPSVRVGPTSSSRRRMVASSP